MVESVMFTIESWYVLGPVAMLGLIWLVLWSRKRESELKLGQVAMIVSFGVYLLCVLHLVFFPIDVNIGEYANQTPWYKTINFIPILTIDIQTFLLNIIMLIPFGMYLPVLFKVKESVKKAATLGFIFSISLEVVQLVIRITLGSGRSTDINDLIANSLGAAIGFIMMKKLLKFSQLKNTLKSFQL
ncbi:VanZ family protein [Litchfieldia salsa]|uniref:VanZ like family protein n=1 Tax=Litchfieldia salsa TaxID=930152 RepID=A0A1H0WLJ0_9BACI|nr:VanZ family protein [Litchfieldia salsa]SDP91582.1 VanZ like family protein [Litchfieldia salsa]